METAALIIGICLVVMVMVSWRVLAPRSPVRRFINARLTELLERERATEAYRTAYDITAPLPAQQVIDAIEQRWGRTVPGDESRFYVHSTIYEQQVILHFGNGDHPRHFAARIDFESRDPAAGTLYFFEAEDHDRVEPADQLRAGLNLLLKELSPDSVVRVRHEPIIVDTWQPVGDETYVQRKPVQHRRRKDSA